MSDFDRGKFYPKKKFQNQRVSYIQHFQKAITDKYI